MKLSYQRVFFAAAAVLLLWQRPWHRARHSKGGENADARRTEPIAGDSQRFSRQDVLNRLKSHSPTHYAGLYNVMKGVTLAAVGLSLGALISQSVPPERALLLLVAVVSVLISYNGEAIGQTIIHLYPATIDVILPMALTVVLLLVVGLPGTDQIPGPMPLEWFAAFAAWNMIAALLVASIASRLDTKLYEPYLWPAIERYRARMWFDATCAASVGVFSLIFLCFRHSYLPEATLWEYAFLAVVSFCLVGGLSHHEATRKELKEGLLEIAERPQPAARFRLAGD
jgi:hypothetical protein